MDQAGDGVRLMILAYHDDAERREYAYGSEEG
jgi:hypothetical protein